MSKNNESNNNAVEMTKYPKDVAVIINRSKNSINTLSIASCLCPAKASENESPYVVYNKFSRFIATIIVNGKSVFGNIPIHDIANIKKRYQYISNKAMDMEISNITSTEESHSEPAYTVRFISGKLKGKTPAQVLMTDGNKDALQGQRDWLVSKLKDYPNNQKIIDAIDNAFTLFDQGKLNTQTNATTPSGGQFVIYKPGMRPLRTKIREDGFWMVYEIQIFWNMGYNYPISFSISNYYAPVKEDANGVLNVQVASKDKSSEITHEIKMSDADFDDVLRKIDTNMRMFETIHASEIFEDSEKAREANRDAAKNNNHNEKSTRSVKNNASENDTSSPKEIQNDNSTKNAEPMKNVTLYSGSEIKERKAYPGDYSMQCFSKPLESGSVPGDALNYNVVIKKDAIQKMNDRWTSIFEKVNTAIKEGSSTALHIVYTQGVETYNNTEFKVVYVHDIL